MQIIRSTHQPTSSVPTYLLTSMPYLGIYPNHHVRQNISFRYGYRGINSKNNHDR